MLEECIVEGCTRAGLSQRHGICEQHAQKMHEALRSHADLSDALASLPEEEATALSVMIQRIAEADDRSRKDFGESLYPED